MSSGWSKPPAPPALTAWLAGRATATACSRTAEAIARRCARTPGLGAHHSRRARGAAGRCRRGRAAFPRCVVRSRRDPYLLGAYADFLLDQDRPGEVLALLDDETRIDPLLLRLALAERRLGAEALGAHVALLQARFDAARRRGDSVHLREEARFTLHLLDRPGAALELARRNWATQREPADARRPARSGAGREQARGGAAGARLARAHGPRGRPDRSAGRSARGAAG